MLDVARDIVDDLHFAARWLVRQTRSYYGHVALRVAEREEFILRYLRPPLNPSDQDLLRFDMKGTCLEGPARIAAGDQHLYRSFPIQRPLERRDPRPT